MLLKKNHSEKAVKALETANYILLGLVITTAIVVEVADYRKKRKARAKAVNANAAEPVTS